MEQLIYKSKRCHITLSLVIIIAFALIVCPFTRLALAQKDIELVKSDYLGLDVIELEGVSVTREEIAKLALAQSIDVQIADWQNKGKQADIIEAESIYDINLTLSGERNDDKKQPPSIVQAKRTVTGYTNVGIEKKLPTGTEIELGWKNERQSANTIFSTMPKYYESRAEISGRQPILKNFFGYIDRATVKLAKIDVSKFDLGTTDKFEDVVYQAVHEYWNLVFTYEMLKSKKKALERAEEFLQITKDQLRRGLTEMEDVHAAEANMRIRLTEFVVYRDYFVDVGNNLKFLLSIESGDVIIPAQPLVYEPEELSFGEELEVAFEHRRDFKQGKLDLEAKGIELKVSDQKRWPELDLIGTYSVNGLDKNMHNALAEPYPNHHPEYMFGFEFKFPLENRAARAEYIRAQSNKAQSILEFKQLGQQIFYEVDERLREIIVAEERVDQSQQIETLQREKLEGEQRKFAMGRSSSKIIIDYQNDLIDAEARAIESLVLYKQALNALERTKNTLLTDYGYTGKNQDISKQNVT